MTSMYKETRMPKKINQPVIVVFHNKIQWWSHSEVLRNVTEITL